jgi:hypothetical protein
MLVDLAEPAHRTTRPGGAELLRPAPRVCLLPGVWGYGRTRFFRRRRVSAASRTESSAVSGSRRARHHRQTGQGDLTHSSYLVGILGERPTRSCRVLGKPVGHPSLHCVVLADNPELAIGESGSGTELAPERQAADQAEAHRSAPRALGDGHGISVDDAGPDGAQGTAVLDAWTADALGVRFVTIWARARSNMTARVAG